MELMDGIDSDLYEYFENLLFKGLMALNKNIQEILTLMRVMSYQSTLVCFENFNYYKFVDRFKPQLYSAEKGSEMVC